MKYKAFQKAYLRILAESAQAANSVANYAAVDTNSSEKNNGSNEKTKVNGAVDDTSTSDTAKQFDNNNPNPAKAAAKAEGVSNKSDKGIFKSKEELEKLCPSIVAGKKDNKIKDGVYEVNI